MSDINILVCDDDREIAGAIEIYLRNEGYNVFKAFDGVQALDIARKQELHLIIMDIMMPRMDGVQTTMKIREEKNIPIIMLSAKSEDYDKITGLNVGADDYIT
ncbi:MAG: response regulator, partial [Anaerovoracaceae bacterium]